MLPSEHFAEAERIIERAIETMDLLVDPTGSLSAPVQADKTGLVLTTGLTTIGLTIAIAQIHATLAQTPSVNLPTPTEARA